MDKYYGFNYLTIILIVSGLVASLCPQTIGHCYVGIDTICQDLREH